MSDTPRTDYADKHGTSVTMRELARRLERELAAAEARLAELNAAGRLIGNDGKDEVVLATSLSRDASNQSAPAAPYAELIEEMSFAIVADKKIGINNAILCQAAAALEDMQGKLAEAQRALCEIRRVWEGDSYNTESLRSGEPTAVRLCRQMCSIAVAALAAARKEK